MDESPRLECIAMVAMLALLFLSTICCGHTTHYIKTTPSTQCPAQPCFTLSEYAQRLPQSLTSNITLLLLPGDHVLHVNFTVENVTDFEILSSSPAANSAAKIVCKGLVSILFRNTSHVAMHGLTFNSCGKCAVAYHNVTTYGVSIYLGVDINITSCSFQESFGTALGVFHSSLYLMGNNNFTNNCQVCSERIHNWVCFGGGIYTNRGILNFVGNSMFSNNSAVVGGGIHAETSILNFIGSSTFRKNSAVNGGGIYASNSTLNFIGNTTFDNNSVQFGGGITAWTSTLNFTGTSTFSNNSAIIGGGIHADSSILDFTGSSTFRNNSAVDGGGICAFNNTLNLVGNSTFSNNFGGGIYVETSSLNFIGNSTFSNSSATSAHGGAISADNSTLNFIGNSTFENNLGVDGGGIIAWASTLNFSGTSTFSNNSAKFGGGIYAESSILDFTGSGIFRSNSAVVGGGVFALNNTLNLIGNNTFSNNLGGGIYAETSTLNVIGNGMFSNNSATSAHGGGISADTSTLNFIGKNSFKNNGGGGITSLTSTLNFSGTSTFSNNSAKCGGAIYASTSILGFTGSNNFRNNSAVSGGGIYASNSTLNFTGNSTFDNNSVRFGVGIISWNSTLNFNGTSPFSNNLIQIGGGIYAESSILDFTGSSTFRNNSAVKGGGICSLYNTLNFIGNSTFSNNFGTGGGINAKISSLNFIGNSMFSKNSATPTCCGGISVAISTLNFIGSSTFRNNSAVKGGGICSLYNTLNFIGNSTFSNNFGAGGGINANTSSLIFIGNSTFSKNSATPACGGGISVATSTLNFIGSSTFKNNLGVCAGGISAWTSTLNFNGTSTFSNNSAKYRYGGGINAEFSTLNFSGDSTFIKNSAVSGGGISVLNSTLNFTGNSKFRNNSALKGSGGGINVYVSVLNFNGNSTFRNNSAVFGGGIYIAMYSTLRVTGKCAFRNNSAERYGGGIMAGYSTMEFTTTNIWNNGGCTVCFTENSALIHGGAVYTEDSTLNFHGSNTFRGNSALHYAGGIYSRNSTLDFSGNTCFKSNLGRFLGGGIYGLGTVFYFSGSGSFTANTAARGGGEYLTNSFNFFSQNTSVIMNNNNATEYGGAVYMEDSNPISYCFPASSIERCFFQVSGVNMTSNQLLSDIFSKPLLKLNETTAHAISALVHIRVRFYNNHAQIAGSAVYGGSIDNCVTDIEFKPMATGPYLLLPSQLASFIISTSTLELEPSSVSSNPFQICLCEGGIPQCNLSDLVRQVYPGELLRIPVVAAGQRDGIVPAVVRAFFNDSHQNTSLAHFQSTQIVNKDCTELLYQMHSSATNNSNTLVLYADGPCSTDGKLLNISLQFLPCPYGFSLNSSEGICGCELRLQKYTARCNITERTITREGVFWVGYDSHSQALILQPYCPFDYCKPATEHISFPLNDTDLQCENSRSGLLCGGCISDFSLALGSSKCLQCSNQYLLLLIPFALAGIALVLLLIVLKLTVAAGTINGLIFYANIVTVNHAIFFPPNQTNILTVFIAWLNLDLGIETCFFDGMDAYVKTWLQFVFPLYVWSLVGLIIIGSDYSSRIARVFGSNPVAVLATLFLLSYAKLLRTIIAALYFTFLDYPYDVRIAVWLYDGNVPYFRGKHIALLLVAVITFLIFFLPYTLLLTVGQWLQVKSNRLFFSWINKPRIKPFLDAYHAPYRDQHRYWTGLMLCLRFILFLVFAFNIEADPSLNLLAIEVVVIGLLTSIHFVGLIYKKLYLDIIEASFILNLGILAAATFYVSQVAVSVSQAAVTYTSVGAAFTTFVGVLLYHMYQQVWPKLQPKIYGLCHHKGTQDENFEVEARTDDQHQLSIAPTITIVERPKSEPLNFIELREPLISSDP